MPGFKQTPVICNLIQRVGMPFHWARHGANFLGMILTKPIVVARNGIMGLFYMRQLGLGHASTKASSRLRSWLSTNQHREGCFLCDWIAGPDQEFGPVESTRWLNHYGPRETLLAKFRKRSWPNDSPRFTLILPLGNCCEAWLEESIQSVRQQVYPNWHLLCIAGEKTLAHANALAEKSVLEDSRIQLTQALVARTVLSFQGQYLCYLEPGDVLEPQALYRFAEAVLQSHPDMLFSDEAQCDTDIKEVRKLVFRGAFSHDSYICRPEVFHFLGFRTQLLKSCLGETETLSTSAGIDLILRFVETANLVSHVPEILYRNRLKTKEAADGATKIEATTRAITEHLGRLRLKAIVKPLEPDFWDIVYQPATGSRVAIIIPTKNQGKLLRTCLDSLSWTVPPGLADVYIIDHQSDEAEALEVMAIPRREGRVIDWNGIFNFSQMNNHAVAHLKKQYSHYLFLNNDIEAIAPGWLEHMVGLGSKPNVGIVGATLIYPDNRAQHAGVVIGLFGGAGHNHRLVRVLGEGGQRLVAGRSAEIRATREVSAVTGACLLVSAAVFHRIKQFDETLAVGFGDIDICLKVRQLGHRVLMDGEAILYHYESLTRGMKPNPHPEDTRNYLSRYADLILSGDPFFHPCYRIDHTLPIPRSGIRAPVSIASNDTILQNSVAEPIPSAA